MTHTTSPVATAIGCIAIFLWGTLALLSKLAVEFPPFQLLALCFSIAFALMLLKWKICGQSIRQLAKQPLGAWLASTAGLFFYHVCYFIAIASAPVLEVSLIAYLWPLLIVLFSALLPGERLYVKHLVGAVLSLFGCWVLLGGGESEFNAQYLVGYLFAAACSLIWSSYSVGARLMKSVPTDAVGLFCGACAVLGWLCHFIWETSYWPTETSQWFAVLGLALGPLGFAFFTWDYGLKHGNIQLLGILSYSAPLISTVLLIAAGQAEGTSTVLFACAAIVSGALIASLKWQFLSRLFKPQRI